MKNICPVCNYDNLIDPPYNEYGYGSYEICPCCGFEFGLDDFPDKEEGIKNWREQWIEGGYKWFSTCRFPPLNWDPVEQLNRE